MQASHLPGSLWRINKTHPGSPPISIAILELIGVTSALVASAPSRCKRHEFAFVVIPATFSGSSFRPGSFSRLPGSPRSRNTHTSHTRGAGLPWSSWSHQDLGLSEFLLHGPGHMVSDGGGSQAVNNGLLCGLLQVDVQSVSNLMRTLWNRDNHCFFIPQVSDHSTNTHHRLNENSFQKRGVWSTITGFTQSPITWGIHDNRIYVVWFMFCVPFKP